MSQVHQSPGFLPKSSASDRHPQNRVKLRAMRAFLARTRASDSRSDAVERLRVAECARQSALIPHDANTYRREAAETLQLFVAPVRMIAAGTFATVHGGYRLSPDGRAQVQALLDRLQHVIESAPVEYCQDQHANIASRIPAAALAFAKRMAR